MLDKNIVEHESFGVLRIHRATNSSEVQLFGSSVKSNEIIRLEIAPATYGRGLNHDWVYGKSLPLIQVNMTQSQFAEAITSLNVSTGTPVTIKRVGGKSIESYVEESKFEQFQNEFDGDTKGLLESISKAQTEVEMLLSKKSVTKGDKEAIRGHLRDIEQMLEANIPFLYKSFNEQVGKTLHEAKMEIEAFAQQRELEDKVKLQLKGAK